MLVGLCKNAVVGHRLMVFIGMTDVCCSDVPCLIVIGGTGCVAF